jgi:hypothetical protein
MAWDGMEFPCMCRAFLHAHFHTTPGRHQEGARVPAETAVPFWEKVLVLSRERSDQEDSEARVVEASMREAYTALEEVCRINQGACVDVREEEQEAREEVERQAEAAAQVAQGDNPRRRTTSERAVATAQQYLEEVGAKLVQEELALELATKALDDAAQEMEAQGLHRREKHATWAEEDDRATNQLEVAKKEKEQEAWNRRDAGKMGSPSAPQSGQVPQPASGPQDTNPGKGKASGHEGSKAATLEEAEATLVGRCVKEALYFHHKIEECETRRTKLGMEAARPDAPEEEKQQLTEAWEKASTDYWRLQEDARKLDLKHMEQARRLRVSFGAEPEQAADTRAARRTELARRQRVADQAADEEAADDRELERLRKETTDEIEAQRTRLAAEEQELRQQSTEADRLESEAKLASASKAYHLSRVLADKEEVEATWNALHADIAKEEAAGRARDASVRMRTLASAVE